MNSSPRRCRALLLAWLVAGTVGPRSVAIAEWQIDTRARVPGETGLTEVGAGPEAVPVVQRPVPALPAPRHASGKIRHAPVEEASIRPVAAILGSEPGERTAQAGADATPMALAEAETVGDAALDTLRGGFETPGGLQVSFGIERLVYVNGELSSVTSINVADLGRLSGGAIDAALPNAGSGTIALIQNGSGNLFAAGELSSAALATVIQNSLDNQRIQAVTTVTATVNSMEMLKAHRLQQTLQDALTQSLLR